MCIFAKEPRSPHRPLNTESSYSYRQRAKVRNVNTFGRRKAEMKWIKFDSKYTAHRKLMKKNQNVRKDKGVFLGWSSTCQIFRRKSRTS